MKQKIFSVLRIAVSLLLIGGLVFLVRDSLPQIMNELKRANKGLFFSSFLIFAVIISISSLRLKVILQEDNIFISLKNAIQLTYIGYFFNNILPTAVGGDIVKVYYVSKGTKQKTRSFVCVFMDRFIGLFSFIMLGTVALLIGWNKVSPDIKGKVVITLILAFCAITSMLSAKIAKIINRIFSKLKFMDLGTKIIKFYEIVHNYRNKIPLIGKAMALSVISQCIYFVMIYNLAYSLGVSLNLRLVFLIMPIVGLISMIPSIGGLGPRELAMVVLFGPTIGKDLAFSLSLLLLGVLIMVSFVGGLLYLTGPRFNLKSIENSGKGVGI